jgi:hypothetical protein
VLKDVTQEEAESLGIGNKVKVKDIGISRGKGKRYKHI